MIQPKTTKMSSTKVWPIWNKWITNKDKPLYERLIRVQKLPNFDLSGETLRFADEGYFKIGDDGEPQKLKVIMNETDDPNRSNIPDDFVSTSNNDTYFSNPNGKWVIIKDNEDEWGVYLNPLGQYGDLGGEYQLTNPKSNLIDYCKKVSSEDPICYCVPPSDNFTNDDMYTCVDQYIGISTRKFLQKNNKAALKEFAKYCGCVSSQRCQDHEIFRKWILPKNEGEEYGQCPTKDITICVAGISADEITSRGGIKVRQDCGATGKVDEPPQDNSSNTEDDSSSGSGSNSDDDNDSSSGSGSNSDDDNDSSSGSGSNSDDDKDSSSGSGSNSDDDNDSSSGSGSNSDDDKDSSSGSEKSFIVDLYNQNKVVFIIGVFVIVLILFGMLGLVFMK